MVKNMKCPECGNMTLKYEINTHGKEDPNYAIRVHTVSCPCGYGDADVY